MISKDQIAETERLNAMTDDALSFALQGARAEDHIQAAETQLALYEALAKLQLNQALENDLTFEGEGALSIFRLLAETHIRIARAMA